MAIPARPAPPRRPRPGAWRALAWQVLTIAVVVLVAWLLFSTTLHNMRLRGIQGGFDFLRDPAGFDIGESWFGYQPSDPYWRAFLVGLMNTLRTAMVGIVACTVIGVLLGAGRFSSNVLVRGICRAITEAIRNVPLLLQLLAWYLLLTEYLPDPGDVPEGRWLQLSKNGLTLGTVNLSPEFLAVTIALSLYTAAFVAEIVRGGIAAVPRGQWEAAQALGLPRRRIMRRIVLPQALRVIIPPLASQYLNLTKNSSLAVAVGYPELVSVANTSLNQSGRAVECIAIIMAVYLLLSLLTAAAMNWWNRRAAIVGH